VALPNAACRVHGHVGTLRHAGGEHAINAQIVFDRFYMVQHLDEAVDAARRELWRQLTSKANYFQSNALAAVEESLESEQR